MKQASRAVGDRKRQTEEECTISWMDLSVLMYQCRLTCKTKNATTQRLRGMGRGSAPIVRKEVLVRESARL